MKKTKLKINALKSTVLLVVVLSMFALSGCTSKEHRIARDAYFEVISYAEENAISDYIFSPRGYPGFSLYFEPSSITIESYTDGKWFNEKGKLTDLYMDDECGLANCENYYDVSVRGNWKVGSYRDPIEGSRLPGYTGSIGINLSRDNELYLRIWPSSGPARGKVYELTDADAQHILEILNSAKEKAHSQ